MLRGWQTLGILGTFQGFQPLSQEGNALARNLPAERTTASAFVPESPAGRSASVATATMASPTTTTTKNQETLGWK